MKLGTNKISAEKKIGKKGPLQSIRIELADGGVMVSCHHQSPMDGPYYGEDKPTVFTDIPKALAYVGEKLGQKSAGKKSEEKGEY